MLVRFECLADHGAGGGVEFAHRVARCGGGEERVAGADRAEPSVGLDLGEAGGEDGDLDRVRRAAGCGPGDAGRDADDAGIGDRRGAAQR